MPDGPSFPRLVSLACHDLRTPLATVHGFARTLPRVVELGEPASRYLDMIEKGSTQLADLLDDLALAARIEGGRYDPALREADTLELAQAAAEQLQSEAVVVSGSGAPVTVDAEAATRAIRHLARCAVRHGGVDRLDIEVDATTLRLAPIAPAAAPIVLAEDLRDLGAAVARLVVEALGGSLVLESERLVVRFAG